MASVNVDEGWKEALYLLEITVEEWVNASNKTECLNRREIEAINYGLDWISNFAEARCQSYQHLVEFYEYFEKVTLKIYSASLKMTPKEP